MIFAIGNSDRSKSLLIIDTKLPMEYLFAIESRTVWLRSTLHN